MFQSYLTGREQYVRLDKGQSQKLPIDYGVPQGSILGPLLFLIYINDITNCSSLLKFILFADDTSILCSNRNLEKLIEDINNELNILSDWFKANKLSLNVVKTNYILFNLKDKLKNKHSSDSNLSDNHQIISIEGINITKVKHTKFLGVVIDEKLNFKEHINYIANKISRSTFVINKLKLKLPKRILLSLYYTLIYPHIQYCIIAWGNSTKTWLNKIHVLQKRAIRIIDNSFYLSHSTPIFKKFNLLKVMDVFKLTCLTFLFKVKTNNLPSNCNNLIQLNNAANPRYHMRYVDVFKCPPHKKAFREKCIKIFGQKLWEEIPNEIASSGSIMTFKRNLKQYLLGFY